MGSCLHQIGLGARLWGMFMLIEAPDRAQHTANGRHALGRCPGLLWKQAQPHLEGARQWTDSDALWLLVHFRPRSLPSLPSWRPGTRVCAPSKPFLIRPRCFWSRFITATEKQTTTSIGVGEHGWILPGEAEAGGSGFDLEGEGVSL